MRKLAALAAGLAAILFAFALPAFASTTTSAKMSFTEPIQHNVNSGCPPSGSRKTASAAMGLSFRTGTRPK
jgi:hypothetical protein